MHYRLVFCLIALSLSSFLSGNYSLPTEIVKQAIERYRERHQVPGVAVVVFYDSQHYFFPFGVADLHSKKPITESTIFELGSITKSFTALLLAAETLKGTVQLNDPAIRYLDGLQKFQGPFSHVTLQQLATHTAGFEHVVHENARSSYQNALSYLRQWQPDHPPGTHYQYSNYGFGLLGIALEHAAHKPYFQLLRENILGPLGMQQTFLQVPPAWQAAYAQGYNKQGLPAKRWPITLVFAAGALKSNATDMSKLLAACLNLPGTPNSVSKAVELTETGHFKVASNKTQVMSWMKREMDGYTIYAKNGGVTGFSTFMAFSPELKTGIVILANKNAENTTVGQFLMKKLAEHLLKERSS